VIYIESYDKEIMAVLKVETDIITSIAASPIGRHSDRCLYITFGKTNGMNSNVFVFIIKKKIIKKYKIALMDM
jgi:hypothetical protein